MKEDTMFDRFWDKLEAYVERYSIVFFIFSMYYLMLYLMWKVTVWMEAQGKQNAWYVL